MGERGLADVQRFVAGAVQRLAPIIRDGELGPEVESLVLPSMRGMTPTDRLEVYRDQFWIRHLKSIAEDFSTLAWALGGAEAFDALAREYLAARPPSTWDLQRLGAKMPDFVQGHAVLGRDAAACDAARLDWAFMEIFDAADAPPFDPRVLASTPEDAWPAARLELDPAVRLVAMASPLLSVREAIKSGSPGGERPAAGPSHVVVWRDPACFPRAVAIDAQAFALLGKLKTGEPLGPACEAVARDAGLGEAALSEQVGAWCQDWTQRGWVSRVLV